VRDLAKMASSP